MAPLPRRRLAALLGATSLAASSPWHSARADSQVKIGFVYFGPIGDFGWTYQHDIGRKQAQAAFNGIVTTSYIENVAAGPAAQAAFKTLATTGHSLIFGTSFDYMDDMVQAAQTYPSVKFEHCTGYKRSTNLATYNIRFYESRYVQGVIAGSLSKTGLAGYVAYQLVPEVVQGINAFLLGMQSVNPAARVKYIIVDSWYDPAMEGQAATALINAGCDIITQHTDSPAPLQVAASSNIPAFGYGTDMISFAPKDQLTASIDLWGGYYTKRFRELLNGTWNPTDTWGGFSAGMLDMAPYRNMPDSVAALATKTVADIASGRNRIFTGPLTDRTGRIFLPDGQTMDDTELSRLQILIKGVETYNTAGIISSATHCV